ncbi:Hypothetical predicted protein [Cloeon dipterum]|uniref:Uncharacterized protein n=1 Tax=Cloeon dipterum TaxID=197152 RepID=A0A8S1DF48_9INSE|nr:Hypothetical predicted protein [Cloeon dipterum]
MRLSDVTHEAVNAVILRLEYQEKGRVFQQQSFKMSKQKVSVEVVAGPSADNGSIACFPCLYCCVRKPFFSKIKNSYKAGSHQYICRECSETEKFTVASLIKKLKDNRIQEGVDVESIRKMEFFKPYQKQKPAEQDISDVTLGFLVLEKCFICDEDLKQSMNYSAFAKHNEKHADEIYLGKLVACDAGCNRLRKRIHIIRYDDVQSGAITNAIAVEQ